MKVMVVDDEPSVRELVAAAMEDAGHACCAVSGGDRAAEEFMRERPDVVVLDVMMPKVDGFEACRRIREIDANVPVLFLSARGDIIDKRVGFANGGDDYVVKPFDEEELVMRVEALHRRATRSTGPEAHTLERFVLGDFEFDSVRHRILRGGEAVSLTPKEFQLLFHLARNHGAVMSKEELVESVWGDEYTDDMVNVAVYVRKLREKIEETPAKPTHLKTVWGVGYVFEA